jgi:site-specific DNA-methyltransferase (adenine-specific)
MRFFTTFGPQFKAAGWRFAQDIVWEKHNGSSFHADRFRRVHEHAVQFYKDGAKWAKVFNDVQKTADATARTVRRKQLPPHHLGARGPSIYTSEDGSPRIMRSVIYMRSTHGRAIHGTEKPDALLEILIRTSCPQGGIVADLFAGSGAAAEAAGRAGRGYIGCEINPEMAAAARDRVNALLPLDRVQE